MTQATNTVRFVLDGRIVEAEGERRTTTVLDYLRETLHRTGTKEGCADGDCGACVVLVGELNGDGTAVNYVPVNSCLQLLPTLDGKSVKTVESLKRPDGNLHPVQDAMVACHGSQCGFCTPGIVMSLTGLVQTVPQPDRAAIQEALSGNLCRCTGYRPIIDAALKACEAPAALLKIDDTADLPLLREIRRPSEPTYTLDGDIVVQPVVRTRKGNVFVSPATVAEVADYLVKHPQSTLLAGSTEFGLQVNKQFRRPEYIVYLGNVAELRQVQDKGSFWRIGAQVSLTAVEALVAEAWPDFAELLRRFGSPPVRSVATLAGNIANGSPIGDTMPCLMALGASLVLRRGDKTRSVLLESFYTGLKKNVLQAGEFIEAIDCPKPKAWRGLPRPQDQQTFRAGHFRHLLRPALPAQGWKVRGCSPGFQWSGAFAGPRTEDRSGDPGALAGRRDGDRARPGDCRKFHRPGRPARHLGLSLARRTQSGAALCRGIH